MITKLLPFVLLLVAVSHADSLSVLYGNWQVNSIRLGNAAAMDDTIANQLYMGKTAQYSKKKVAFLKDFCKTPAYRFYAAKTEDYLYGFQITREELNITSDTLTIISVICNNEDWVAPGGIVILLSEKEILVPWDGVFLVMYKIRGR